MTNLQTLVFYATPEHDCSYLPGEKATTMFLDPKALVTTDIYTQLSRFGFRRSGNHFYRPHCNHCKACIPIRLPVESFRSSRSQRRVMKRNAGVNYQIMAPDFHEDHYLLYEKYICERHRDGDMYPPSREQYRSFLVEGHASTRFVEFSIEGRLYAVAVVDVLIDGISAIYTFFDPELEKLSPGTFAVLWQLQYASEQKLPYIYLGYFIKNCQKMSYKNQFHPFEALINDQWLHESDLERIIEQSPPSPES